MHLHIVAFNVPYPADYGGVIDAYNRVVALSQAGAHVHLHCFLYGRPPAPQLEQWCEEVCYYNRRMSPWLLLSRIPFIAISRRNSSLMQRLSQDNHPILLEGVHTCECLRLLRQIESGSSHRFVAVRTHNVEADYYRLLARAERSPFRRLYLLVESRRLRRYEKAVLPLADHIFAVTDSDAAAIRAMGCRQVETMLSFPPKVDSSSLDDKSELLDSPERSRYVLYHGDLSIPDNQWAVRWIIRNLASRSSLRFVVAGRNPGTSLYRLAARHPNVTLLPSPDDKSMRSLLANAHCMVLLTRQPTGLKLKLLNSLLNPGHCLVNSAMVSGTPFAPLCVVADNPDEMLRAVHRLMSQPLDATAVKKRHDVLSKQLDNRSSAQRILSVLKQGLHTRHDL